MAYYTPVYQKTAQFELFFGRLKRFMSLAGLLLVGAAGVSAAVLVLMIVTALPHQSEGYDTAFRKTARISFFTPTQQRAEKIGHQSTPLQKTNRLMGIAAWRAQREGLSQTKLLTFIAHNPPPLPPLPSQMMQVPQRPTNIGTLATQTAKPVPALKKAVPSWFLPATTQIVVANASLRQKNLISAPPKPDIARVPSIVPLPEVRPSQSRTEKQERSYSLAYMKPNNNFGQKSNNPLTQQGFKTQPGIAVYDISAQRVYMPNGEVLEAHSGLGKYRDKPQYADLRSLGPTPPHTYRLSMREKLFHGVEALRLTPIDGIKQFGRDGLLTHSYLRRRPGDSAGCVAFKNYDKFLHAYKEGEIKELIVVSSIKAIPSKRLKPIFVKVDL